MIRILLSVVLLAASSVSALSTRRVYAVSWSDSATSPEQRELSRQIDRELRAALRQRGAFVVESRVATAIVLKPSIEVWPKALKLNVVGVRDRKLLGTISAKAAGSTRDAQVKALVARASAEAEQL